MRIHRRSVAIWNLLNEASVRQTIIFNDTELSYVSVHLVGKRVNQTSSECSIFWPGRCFSRQLPQFAKSGDAFCPTLEGGTLITWKQIYCLPSQDKSNLSQSRLFKPYEQFRRRNLSSWILQIEIGKPEKVSMQGIPSRLAHASGFISWGSAWMTPTVIEITSAMFLKVNGS